MKDDEHKPTIRDKNSEFLLYSTDSGTVKVHVLLGEETVWLTINRMAELFGVDKSSVSRHLKNIYESGELDREATVAKIATVQIESIIERRQPFTMEAFAESVNKFLTFNEYQVLEDFGSVKRTAAEAKAAAEYEKFNRTQKLDSDFDKSVRKLDQRNKRLP